MPFFSRPAQLPPPPPSLPPFQNSVERDYFDHFVQLQQEEIEETNIITIPLPDLLMTEVDVPVRHYDQGASGERREPSDSSSSSSVQSTPKRSETNFTQVHFRPLLLSHSPALLSTGRASAHGSSRVLSHFISRHRPHLFPPTQAVYRSRSSKKRGPLRSTAVEVNDVARRMHTIVQSSPASPFLLSHAPHVLLRTQPLKKPSATPAAPKRRQSQQRPGEANFAPPRPAANRLYDAHRARSVLSLASADAIRCPMNCRRLARQ